jgi:hypothetical protein
MLHGHPQARLMWVGPDITEQQTNISEKNLPIRLFGQCLQNSHLSF